MNHSRLGVRPNRNLGWIDHKTGNESLGWHWGWRIVWQQPLRTHSRVGAGAHDSQVTSSRGSVAQREHVAAAQHPQRNPAARSWQPASLCQHNPAPCSPCCAAARSWIGDRARCWCAADTMLRVLALLASATTVAAHASYMIEPARCDRALAVGETIMGVCTFPDFSHARATLRSRLPLLHGLTAARATLRRQLLLVRLRLS